MEFLQTFSDFITKIVELIKNLVDTIRKMNDGKLDEDEEAAE